MNAILNIVRGSITELNLTKSILYNLLQHSNDFLCGLALNSQLVKLLCTLDYCTRLDCTRYMINADIIMDFYTISGSKTDFVPIPCNDFFHEN